MSFDVKTIRQPNNDDLNRFVVDIAKKVSRVLADQQLNSIEKPEDVFSDGRDIESEVKFHDELVYTNRMIIRQRRHFSPSEPNGTTMKLWLQARALGNQLRDISKFNHHATIHGEPLLVDGNFDYGNISGPIKSVAMRFNRPTSPLVNKEWIQVPDHDDFRITTLTTGFAFMVRIRPQSIEEQNGKSVTLMSKIDDNGINNGFMAQIRRTGNIMFVVRRGGVDHAVITTIPMIDLNSVVELWFSYNPTGHAMTIDFDNNPQVLSTFTGSINFQTNKDDHDLYIMRRGPNDYEGMVYGDLYDVKFFKEYVPTYADKSNHYGNKYTFAPIAFGEVFISNYILSYRPVPPPTFTNKFSIKFNTEGVTHTPTFTNKFTKLFNSQ